MTCNQCTLRDRRFSRSLLYVWSKTCDAKYTDFKGLHKFLRGWGRSLRGKSYNLLHNVITLLFPYSLKTVKQIIISHSEFCAFPKTLHLGTTAFPSSSHANCECGNNQDINRNLNLQEHEKKH